MNGYGYGPGAGLTSNNRFARMLMRQQDAAPPVTQHTQGLAQVLRGGLSGWMMGEDQRDRAAANEAMTRGMGAQPWINPDTGNAESPYYEDTGSQTLAPVMVPSQAAGGIPGAIAATQKLGGNEYAQRNLQGLLMQQGATEAATAERELGWAREDAQATQKHKRALELAEMGGGDLSQKVRDYQFFITLDPEDQQTFLTVSRANRPVDLGGYFGTIDPQNPSETLGEVTVTLAPEQEPEYRAAVEAETTAASAVGAEAGDAAARLSAAEASMPQLQAAAAELKELGKTATYTHTGQAIDFARREAGMEPSPGSLARVAYIAHVKNNVLPLLRQTFGAAFTAAEGDSLLATLGDPDMHPQEKAATLDAFISDKMATLQSLQRQVGGAVSPAWQPPVNDGDWSIEAVE
jgi:hypothetical protein